MRKKSDILLAQEVNLPKDEKKKQELIKKLENKCNETIMTCKEINGCYIATIVNNTLKDYLTKDPDDLMDGRAIGTQIVTKSIIITSSISMGHLKDTNLEKTSVTSYSQRSSI